MNKKEVAEIKKQFRPNRAAINTICGCYVNNEGNKILVKKKRFASLSEEEQAKYFEIFKKALSGKIEKNLINMEFPNEQEEDGGAQHFLMELRRSELDNDDLLERLYDKIISTYSFSGNYYITLINSSYDIPSMAGDGSQLDASTDTYSFVLCAICPVTLTKPALAYNKNNNNIEDKIRDWEVQAPLHGILFPAFNDRNTDIHSVLYFSKKDKDLQPGFVNEMLGIEIAMPASLQKEAFKNIIESTLDTKYSYVIHSELQKKISEQQFTAESNNETNAISFTKKELKQLLSKCGASESDLNNFDSNYDREMGQYKEYSLKAENIIDTSKSVIKTANISINVKSDSKDLVSVKTIDGKKCIIIEATNDVLINGVATNL